MKLFSCSGSTRHDTMRILMVGESKEQVEARFVEYLNEHDIYLYGGPYISEILEVDGYKIELVKG